MCIAEIFIRFANNLPTVTYLYLAVELSAAKLQSIISTTTYTSLAFSINLSLMILRTVSPTRFFSARSILSM